MDGSGLDVDVGLLLIKLMPIGVVKTVGQMLTKRNATIRDIINIKTYFI